MKTMQPASARALIITAILVMLAGFLVPSPSGAFLGFCLAALLTGFPAIFGSGKVRLIAALLLFSSVALAAGKYPSFKSEQERHRQRSATTSAPQSLAALG